MAVRNSMAMFAMLRTVLDNDARKNVTDDTRLYDVRAWLTDGSQVEHINTERATVRTFVASPMFDDVVRCEIRTSEA